MAIAVDLDGTLVEYDGWRGVEHIGNVVQPMMDRVKAWVAAGEEVSIFTARVSGDDAAVAYTYVHMFLVKHGLGDLEITAIKDKKFTEFWDDRAVHVIRNTGMTLQEALDENIS